MASFGGRGGGGGPGAAPGVTFDVARGRLGGTGPAGSAYFPASASGGGALNLRTGCAGGAGGEGSRGGGDIASSVGSVRALRDGGGGGGPRRLPEFVPVPWGLIVFTLGTPGGGGGGARGFG